MEDIQLMSDDALIVAWKLFVLRAADGDYVSAILFDIEDEMEKRGLLILPNHVRHNLN